MGKGSVCILVSYHLKAEGSCIKDGECLLVGMHGTSTGVCVSSIL